MATLAEQVRAYEREIRDYGRQQRRDNRRLERLPVPSILTLSPAQERKLDRDGERTLKRVRNLVERGLRALDRRSDDALSDFIDAAAILATAGGLEPSRAGYMVMSAKEFDEISDFAVKRAERGCRPHWK
jgi:hypothetical protein